MKKSLSFATDYKLSVNKSSIHLAWKKIYHKRASYLFLKFEFKDLKHHTQLERNYNPG